MRNPPPLLVLILGLAIVAAVPPKMFVLLIVAAIRIMPALLGARLAWSAAKAWSASDYLIFVGCATVTFVLLVYQSLDVVHCAMTLMGWLSFEPKQGNESAVAVWLWSSLGLGLVFTVLLLIDFCRQAPADSDSDSEE